jgi:hypothetical protein
MTLGKSVYGLFEWSTLYSPMLERLRLRKIRILFYYFPSSHTKAVHLNHANIQNVMLWLTSNYLYLTECNALVNV